MPVTKSTFGEYVLYTIKNSSGAYVRIASLGAAVQSIVVPNRNGAPTDVVLGYDTPGEYLRNDGYFGAFVGRYANRIANASFMLNGREYKISANEGKNTLHGGNGLSKRRFTEIAVGENALTLGISDPDGGGGKSALLGTMQPDGDSFAITRRFSRAELKKLPENIEYAADRAVGEQSTSDTLWRRGKMGCLVSDDIIISHDKKIINMGYDYVIMEKGKIIEKG